MIPAAGPAYLDDMYRELFASLGEAHQLLGRASRSGDRPEPVAEDPGYEGQLFFPADGACDLAPPTVELRRTQEIRICITHLGDIDPARIDVSQQRPAPEGVVDNLPLNSHENQSSGVGIPPPRAVRIDRSGSAPEPARRAVIRFTIRLCPPQHPGAFERVTSTAPPRPVCWMPPTPRASSAPMSITTESRRPRRRKRSASWPRSPPICKPPP